MSTASVSPRVWELVRFTETHQRHTAALATATGEHFNIFNILGIGHLEVTTHSPVLGELLNAKGTHGQGAAFLCLFLSHFGIHGFDAHGAAVKLEYHTGPVTEKSGGRIDIVIHDRKGSMIFLENKIYAGDQPHQMERYRAFEGKAHLFYLTLYGQEPSNLSAEDLKRIQCKCISYSEDILEWLKECRKEAACLPNLRETLSQYIHLLQELTGQSTTTRMNDQLINEIVGSKESLQAFFTLRDSEEAVRASLIAKLDVQLNDVAKATGLQRDGSLRDLHRKESGFYFNAPGLQRCNLQIGFIFEKGYYGDFYFGFTRLDNAKPCPVKEQLLAAFKTHFHAGEPTEYVPAWAWWEHPYRYWRHEAFEAIRSGQFVADLRVKLEKLAQIAIQVCPAHG